MNVVTLSLLPFFTVSKLEKSPMRQPPPYFLPLPDSPLKMMRTAAKKDGLSAPRSGRMARVMPSVHPGRQDRKLSCCLFQCSPTANENFLRHHFFFPCENGVVP